MTDLLPDERRDFYRIHDQVGLQYQLVEDQALPSMQSFVAEVPDEFQLVNHLARIDADSSTLLHSISDRAPEVGRYLRILNNKIESIARHIVTHQLDSEIQMQEVTLSAGGIGFHSPLKLSMGDLVRCQMVLYPSCTGILTYGEVVRSVPLKDSDEFDIALEYVRIQESDRDVLVRHVLQLQSNLLRLAKSEREQEASETEE